MQISRIAGATRTVGESQGYRALPIRDEVINCAVGGERTNAMVTAWLPTPEEIAAINAGAAIHVKLIGTGHPPIIVEIGEIREDGDSLVDKIIRRLFRKSDDADARLARIEHLCEQMAREQLNVERKLMASRQIDDALIAEIHRNTDVTKAATAALAALQATDADLTQKLADAIANSSSADDPAVQSALDELKANNDATAAATPQVAAAIANTDPGAPAPVVEPVA